MIQSFCNSPGSGDSAAAATSDFLAELSWRGLLHQVTDEAMMKAHLASGVRSGYAGFDPTADSLTVGNLVPIMLLRHWQNAGHKPVVLVGGGTGLIGDPSGKSSERELMTDEKVRANVEGQKRIFGRLLDFSDSGPAASRGGEMVNNLDWLGKMGYIQMLRDVGKFFSINAMLQRDSVKNRLESREQGISYTEFSYVLLQAYDYLHLHRTMNVTTQLGGSDQWGNIVSGIDLIRRDAVQRAGGSGAEDLAISAFGVTAPLVTKADGGKFGKSESGAVWLTADRTSPYAYYQFWLNAADADVGRFLRIYTLLAREQIEDLEQQLVANPGVRAAQRALAVAATDLLHGQSERQRAEVAAGALFSGDVKSLDAAMLGEVLAGIATATISRGLLDGEGVGILDLIAQTGLVSSKGDGRTQLQAGAISVNGAKVGMEYKVSAADILHGELVLLRKGKKNWLKVGF